MVSTPDSLYKLVIQRIANGSTNFQWLKMSSYFLTNEMRFDICLELYALSTHSEVALQQLEETLSTIDVFQDFLQIGHKRMELHKMFELINEKNYVHEEKPLGQTLSDAFIQTLRSNSYNTVGLGLNLASFLMDAGWYSAAADVLSEMKRGLHGVLTVTELKQEVDAKLLHAFSEYRQFDKASEVLQDHILLKNDGNPLKMYTSSELCEIGNYYFWRSLYQDAHSWSIRALRTMTTKTPSRVVIDILRQSGKSSVVRRQFSLAHLLLKEALLHAKDIFGKNHLKYADCLFDYAFYLLNVDEVSKSVLAYEEALQIRESILGRNNLLVAKAYEELAYAKYVHEYSSGQFEKAKTHAEAALFIMQKIIPANHLLVASSQRVLALILEEIAIDMTDKTVSQDMLLHSEQLHLSAVSLSTQAFGEMNVQTAKHYGNLGRLYQTMERYDQAEQMHLKAIKIKEALLGPDDYEVALSIGHLASLYNYDLDEFTKAEELYLRSINIALRLFGPSYSGLEYDYRGLVRVYEETDSWDNVLKYIYMLREWKELKIAKEENNRDEDDKSGQKISPRSVDQILQMVDQNEECQRQKQHVILTPSSKSPSTPSDDQDSASSPQHSLDFSSQRTIN